MDSAQDIETLAQERQMLSLLRETMAMLPDMRRQVSELRVYRDSPQKRLLNACGSLALT